MKRIVLIDDEVHARQSLQTMLSALCPDVEIIGEAGSVASGVRLIRQAKPQAVLLDISMEDGSGFDLLDHFPNLDFKVIFTTASSQFAVRAFRYNALDYLLKPVIAKELVAAIDRLQAEAPEAHSQKIRNMLEETRQNHLSKIALSSQEGLVFLLLDQVVRLQSDGNYTTFCLMNKERHVAARPLKEFEEMLPEKSFFRIHQSHIVNRFFVRKVLKEDGGCVLMQDGSKLSLAGRRKQEFLAWVMEEA